MNTKKIGIDVRLWNQTGIGRYIRNLVSYLLDLDSENQYVLFARPEDNSDIKNHLATNKYNKNVILIETKIKWHSISEQIEFPRLLNKYKLELMHFPYFSVPVFYKKPFVVTVHDLIINHFPTGRATTLPAPLYKVKKMGYDYVLKKAILNSEQILVPSDATKDEIILEYKIKKDKITVTPEGVDDGINSFAPALFKEINPYFLYVGNAYPHKNLERFLDAFKLFAGQGSFFTLKLVGREDYFYKRLKEYVVKEKIMNISFLGFVTDHELSKLYSQATATFIPSLMEGFGLTALEAMKMGSLIAVSKIPSLEEVCANFAVYFDPDDTLSIASAMQQVTSMKEDDRKKLISSAQKHAEKFSWKKTAELTLAVYNSCVK